MADYALNLARAALGQGAGMGWGDEAEAWLRSKLGQGDYEQNLKRIRGEYAQFAEENPKMQTLSEFAGGVAPGVAAMFVPGMQGVGAQQVTRSTLGTLARMGSLGALSGAVSGAGSATEGNRLEGAVSGGTIGGVLGAGLPIAGKAAGAGARWLRERVAPSNKYIAQRSAQKMNEALQEAGLTPQDISRIMAGDVRMGVPSVVGNVAPTLTDLSETVAQRAGAGSMRVAEKLGAQKAGARERTYQQVVKALKPGDYYADEAKLVGELRKRAGTLYDDAYALGSVEDPRIMEVLKSPSFKGFYDKAREIAKSEELAARLRGEDTSKFKLKEIYKLAKDADGNTIVVGVDVPDVRTLDYIKRGIDASIDSGFKGQGMSTAEANALKDLRNVFTGAIDEATGGANSPYRLARQQYAGDMEVIDAMRTGMSEFGKLDHEQVAQMVAKMSDSEKEAFRTGVARGLYSKVMDPSGNFNAAQRVIGSPEMQAKLQPLFDSPAQFDLFKTALEREAQLFHQANQVLGGAQTGKRMQMRAKFEQDPGVGEAIVSSVTGSFWPSLANSVLRGFNRIRITDDIADKMSSMLMSRDPHEVAAVVKLLEDQASAALPQAMRAGAATAGAVTGSSIAIHPPTSPEQAPSADIASDIAAESAADYRKAIEADIAAEAARQAEQQQPQQVSQ